MATLRTIFFICFSAFIIMQCVARPSLQFIPPRDGYIPVYIRIGDTPLDEINLELAAAFHENGLSTRQIKSSQLAEELMMADQSDSQSDSDSSSNEETKKPAISSTQTILDVTGGIDIVTIPIVPITTNKPTK